jgi:hypothetical protein
MTSVSVTFLFLGREDRSTAEVEEREEVRTRLNDDSQSKPVFMGYGDHMTMEQFHPVVGHFYPPGKTCSLESFVSSERRYDA